MKRRFVAITPTVVLAAFLLTAAGLTLWARAPQGESLGLPPGYGGSMMGYGVNPSTTQSGSAATSTTTRSTESGPTTSISTSSQPSYPSGTMGIGQAIEMMRALPAHALVNATGNTITFDSQEVSVAVLATMPEEATNLTGLQPPGYSGGDVFVICGLINPTLILHRGATLNITVVNLDDDMYHNLVLMTLSPPYGYMMMASNGMGPGVMYDADNEFLSAMPVMSPANYQQGYAYSHSYAVTLNNPGTFWYTCTYPGHAQSGMYGQIVAK